VGIVINTMKAEDLDEVMVIERYSFPTPWSRAIYEYDISKNPRSRFFCAKDEDSGEVVGYIGAWFVADECHVGTIAVKKEHRGRGIAKLLLSHIASLAYEEGLEYIILEVRINNIVAINLYKSLGFVQAGVRKGYYTDTGEDAIIFVCRDLEALARRCKKTFDGQAPQSNN